MAAAVTSLHLPRLMCYQHDGQHVNGSSQADGRQRWKWGLGLGARLAGLCNQRKVTELVFQGPVISSCKCHFVLCFLWTHRCLSQVALGDCERFCMRLI